MSSFLSLAQASSIRSMAVFIEGGGKRYASIRYERDEAT